ncbi:uncharacterized protein LOC134846225 [Symsagittifera roscoffensis]|uniref:uncharacterized protein LOC134846225 n=1 Tax=Symsagittifera roscoffensis TaxID=84072 RepID=UPI00307C19A2
MSKKQSGNAIRDDGNCLPAFIVVRHGDDEKSILNADCRVELLLDAVRQRCRIDRDADIDFVDEEGKLQSMGDNASAKKYVHQVLQDRATFIPLAIDKFGPADDDKKFIPLLSSKTMQVEYPTIYGNLQSLAQTKGTKRVGAKSKKLSVAGRSSRLK